MWLLGVVFRRGKLVGLGLRGNLLRILLLEYIGWLVMGRMLVGIVLVKGGLVEL